MGNLIDKHHRLRILQRAIVSQKVSTSAAYGLLAIVYYSPNFLEEGSLGSHAKGRIWLIFSLTVICGVAVKLATVCIQVSIERDWATTIASGSDSRLVVINTSLRRIVSWYRDMDLVSS